MEKLKRKSKVIDFMAVMIFTARQAIVMLTSFMLSYTRLFECLPSFSIAFSAAVPKKYIISASLGGIIGTVVFSDNMLIGITGAACVLTAGIINATAVSLMNKNEIPVISFVSAMIVCATAGITVLISDGFYFSGLVLFVCDGILSGGAAYFYVKSLRALKSFRNKPTFSESEIICMIVSFCAMIMSLSRVSFYVFVPSRVLTFLVILWVAYAFGETAACASGILCGAALEMSTEVRGLACCISLCGLVSGFFVKRGRVFELLSAVFVTGAFAVISGTAQSGAVFVEMMTASAIFFLIPKRFMIKSKKYFKPQNKNIDIYSENKTRKLKNAAKAVSGITPIIEKSKRADNGNSEKIKAISFVKDTVCADCGMNSSCWGEGQTDTVSLFKKTVSVVEKNGTVTPDELPEELSGKCIRKNMLSAAFIQAYMEFCKNSEKEKRDDRFFDASLILSDFAKLLSGERKNFSKISETAQEVLRNFSIETKEVACCEENSATVLRARVVSFGGSINKTLLSKEMTQKCGCSFDIPTVSRDKNGYMLTFTQIPYLKLRTGTVQYAADKSGICGDFFITFKEEGKQYFILSDGMGTGEQAAKDSEAAAEIFSSLVRAGMSFSCALKTVNSALLRREDTESVSTLDILCVDLYNGETVFLKAGAAPSYILSEGKVSRVEMPSMPVGILDGISFAKEETVLSKGDVVLMVSDGTCAVSDRHIIKTLSSFKGGSAQELAEKVLKASGKKTDDSTVLAIVL